MTNVTYLAEAMEAAGYATNKALAEAAGVSATTVSRALKLGEVNGMTAVKLQTACGGHRIGPLVDLPAGADDEAKKARLRDLEEQFNAMDKFPGTPFFWDRAHGHLVLTGTRMDDNGLVEWGSVVFTPSGDVVGEAWGYDSHWPVRDEGKRLAKDAGS